MSSADMVCRSRGRGSGRPCAEPVRVRLMVRCSGRLPMEGEAEGEVDMRSRSLSGSSESALRFRPDMLDCLAEYSVVDGCVSGCICVRAEAW